MALAQQFDVVDPHPRRAQPVLRNNVIPFSPRRVTLNVTLPLESEDQSRAQIKMLFRSPIGVYVVASEIVRREVRVQFEIAPEDVDFTMHTLIVTLPQATIGPVERRGVFGKAH
jgi:hypothetical protein